MARERCPVCLVEIEGNVVYFSTGKPGDRENLKAKVCQYAKNKADCINKSAKLVESKGYRDDRIPMETALEWAKDLNNEKSSNI
jgi:hypothetical protein